MRASLTPASLVGRAEELHVMRALLEPQLPGGTRSLVLSGEAGIGKTRLVDEFMATVPGHAVVAVGQSIDLDADAPPYAPVVGMLRALRLAVGTDQVVDAAGTSSAALSVLLPEIDVPSPHPGSPRAGADWLYDSVAVMLENLSRAATLVLVVEDIHWADQATIGLLRYLIHVLDQADILFVLTFRTDDVRSRALRSWLPELDRSDRVTRINLSRLTRDEVRLMANGLVGSTIGTDELAVLYGRSEGVPFLVEELLAVGGSSPAGFVPPGLRGLLLARYDTLTPQTQRVIRLLAAGGMQVEHALLAEVYDDDSDSLDSAAREAIDACVLVAEGTAYRFRHALVRDAIHEELLPGERSRFHSEYARALQAQGGLEETTSVAISYHWLSAHNITEAFTASVAAMSQARSAYAFTTAARMGERALELWPQVPDAGRLVDLSRGDLLAATAYALRNAGDSDRAIILVDDALSELDPQDRSRRAALLRDKASYLANVGRLGSVELLREALTLLEDEPASVLRASVLGELAARLMLLGSFDEAVETADAAFAESESVGSLPRMSVAANIRGMSLLSSGNIEGGLAGLELSGRLAGGEDSPRLRYWINLSDAMTKLGRFEDGARLALEGVEYARSRGLERTKGAILVSNLAEASFAIGEWNTANQLLDRALELNPPLGYSAPLQELKLWALLWGGRPEEAARLLRTWHEPLRRQLRLEAQVRLGMAGVSSEIHLENGDLSHAWAEVQLILDPGHRGQAGHDLPVLFVAARVLAAMIRKGAGTAPATFDAQAAERQLRSVLARYAGWPTHPAYAALFEAELGGTHGPGTDAELWRQAIVAVSAPTAPAAHMAWARVRLAEALACAGDRAGSLTEAESALALAEPMGAGLVVQRVKTLSERAGLQRTDRTAGLGLGLGLGTLTDRENQVLDLVSRGLTNRQIAQHLFISAKTASVHVSAILRKTGATSRTEAVFLAKAMGAQH